MTFKAGISRSCEMRGMMYAYFFIHHPPNLFCWLSTLLVLFNDNLISFTLVSPSMFVFKCRAMIVSTATRLFSLKTKVDKKHHLATWQKSGNYGQI